MDVNKAKELLRNNTLKAVEQPLATPPVEEPLSIRGGIVDNDTSNTMLGTVDFMNDFGSMMNTGIEELKEIEDLEPLPVEEDKKMVAEISLEDFTEEKETETETVNKTEVKVAKPVVKEGVTYKLAFVPEPILGVLGELVETPIEQVLEIKGTKYALVDLAMFADNVE